MSERKGSGSKTTRKRRHSGQDLVERDYRLGKGLLVFAIFSIVVLAIAGFFVYKKHTAEDDYRKKLKEKERLVRLIAQEQDRSKEIDEYKAYVQTRSYLEEVAREVLGLVYKDEIIFEPEAGMGSTPTPTPAP